MVCVGEGRERKRLGDLEREGGRESESEREGEVFTGMYTPSIVVTRSEVTNSMVLHFAL
jgi:hypothetical protein